MKLIKCRKCGASICTDEAFQERMLDAIAECHEKARRDKRNANSYLQEAATYKKMLAQFLHRTVEYESALRRIRYEQSTLVAYLLQNGIVTQEKMIELNEIGRARAAAKDCEDAKVIEELYGMTRNPLFNKTKADTTAKEAIGGKKYG